MYEELFVFVYQHVYKHVCAQTNNILSFAENMISFSIYSFIFGLLCLKQQTWNKRFCIMLANSFCIRLTLLVVVKIDFWQIITCLNLHFVYMQHIYYLYMYWYTMNKMRNVQISCINVMHIIRNKRINIWKTNNYNHIKKLKTETKWNNYLLWWSNMKGVECGAGSAFKILGFKLGLCY